MVAVRLALTALPFRWVRSLAERPRQAPGRSSEFTVEELAWAVSAAARRVPRSTCLTQALALESLLRREAYDASLRLGVAKTPEGALEAHAWLESDGRVVIGGPRSARFVSLPLPSGNDA